MKRLSSLRTTLAPIPSIPMLILPPGVSFAAASLEARRSGSMNERQAWLFGGLRHLHARCCVQHRLDNVVVAGAAADIAFKLMAHGRFIELAAIAVDDVDRGHDHARRAEAALQAMIVAERRLHRMQLGALGDTFDGGDIGA